MKQPSRAQVKDFIRHNQEADKFLGYKMRDLLDHEIKIKFGMSTNKLTQDEKEIWQTVQSRFYSIRAEGMDKQKQLVDSGTPDFVTAFKEMKKFGYFTPFRNHRTGYFEPVSIQQLYSILKKQVEDSEERLVNQEAYLDTAEKLLFKEAQAGLISWEEVALLLKRH